METMVMFAGAHEERGLGPEGDWRLYTCKYIQPTGKYIPQATTKAL